MPYGVKRGYKAPGEFGITDIAGLAFSGSAGIIAALVTDYQQSAEASALFTMNRWAVALGSMFGFSEIPLYVVVLAVIGIGAGSIFYFQPITRQGAFAQGFGLLAVLMTAIPTDLASGIEDILGDDSLPGLGAPDFGDISEVSFVPSSAPNGAAPPATIQNAAIVQKASITGVGVVPITAATNSAAATTAAVQGESRAAQYKVRLIITFEGGLKGNLNNLVRRGLLRGRLHNEDTGETFNLFRNAGGVIRHNENTLIIDAGVPARSESAKLWVRIESNGHQIETQSAESNLREALRWRMTVKESSTPLFLQRLGKVYWF